MKTIQELIDNGTVDAAHSRYFDTGRPVNWNGTGWYSLDDDKVYQPGLAPTYSRIWLTASAAYVLAKLS